MGDRLQHSSEHLSARLLLDEAGDTAHNQFSGSNPRRFATV
jgi:hypothetical protein